MERSQPLPVLVQVQEVSAGMTYLSWRKEKIEEPFGNVACATQTLLVAGEHCGSAPHT